MENILIDTGQNLVTNKLWGNIFLFSVFLNKAPTALFWEVKHIVLSIRSNFINLSLVAFVNEFLALFVKRIADEFKENQA